MHFCHRSQPTSTGCNGNAADDDDDDDDVDPKLKDAILKSRKLDVILQRKFQKEKNVKRERIQLYQRCIVFYISIYLLLCVCAIY